VATVLGLGVPTYQAIRGFRWNMPPCSGAGQPRGLEIGEHESIGVVLPDRHAAVHVTSSGEPPVYSAQRVPER
jgi:hypothetical protein